MIQAFPLSIGQANPNTRRIMQLVFLLLFLGDYSFAQLVEVPSGDPNGQSNYIYRTGSTPSLGGYIGSAQWVDYDDDGDLDLAVITSELGRGIYMNTNGTITEEGADVPLADDFSIYGIDYKVFSRWTDFNNDGLIDVVYINGDGISIYQNNGNGTFTKNTSGFGAFRNGSVDAGDFDNDGLVDLVMIGMFGGTSPQTRLYKNNGNFSFIEVYSGQLAGTGYTGDVRFADVDNDGLLDVIVTGTTASFAGTPSNIVYRNNGNGFSQLISLDGRTYTHITLGDFNSDGYIDYATQGYGGVNGNTNVTTIYINNSGTSFTPFDTNIPQKDLGYSEFVDYDMDGDLDLHLVGYPFSGEDPSVVMINTNNSFSASTGLFPSPSRYYLGAAAWGDYNNDGKMDCFIMDYNSSGNNRLLRNASANTNTLPGTPTGLTSTSGSTGVTLSWLPATDAETPTAGLTYNVMVGTTSGGVDVVSPLANTITGYRHVVRQGNAGSRTSFNLNNLPDGTYYWRVQAIDNSYAGSPFSTEGTFTVTSAVTATVTISNLSHTYDGTGKAVTVVTNPSGLNVDVTYDGSPTLPVNAGSYAVVATVNQTGYVGSNTATLVINKAALTATADDKGRVYGAANPAFTINYSGFVNGEDATAITAPTASTTATTASDAGAYPITLSGGSATNYALTLVNGTLTVTQAALTATADDKSRVYGAANPAFTITYSGFVNGDDATSITAPTATTTATTASDVGTYPITLSGGSAVNYSLSLNDGTLTINKADQTISITAIPDKARTSPPFDVSATVSSGLPLTYQVSGPATISGTTITLTGTTGTVTVTVSQAGTGNYNPASEQITFTVNDLQSQTITFAAITDKTYGDAPFTLSATASSGLPVSFSVVSGPVSLSGNEVTITGAGTAVIAANQAGDATYNPASEVTQTFAIAKADQVITVTAIDDKLVNAAPFAVVASVDTGLPLTYQVSGPATISGTTITLTGTAGTVTVTVSQAGTDDYNPASEQVAFAVNDLQSQTITFAAITDKTYGDAPFTLSATASSGLAVTYSVVSGPVSLSGNEVTITGAGAATISVNQAGDANYLPAPEVTQTFTIAKADQVITFAAIEDQILEDGSMTLSAEAGSGLPVSFSVVSGPVTINGNEATFDGLGTVTIAASQAGNDNFNAAPVVEQVFEIVTVTGIELQGPGAIAVYPNPVAKYLIVSGKYEALQIYTTAGRIVYQTSVATERVDVSALTPGNYMIKLSGKSGISTFRFIKQ